MRKSYFPRYVLGELVDLSRRREARRSDLIEANHFNRFLAREVTFNGLTNPIFASLFTLQRIGCYHFIANRF